MRKAITFYYDGFSIKAEFYPVNADNPTVNAFVGEIDADAPIWDKLPEQLHLGDLVLVHTKSGSMPDLYCVTSPSSIDPERPITEQPAFTRMDSNVIDHRGDLLIETYQYMTSLPGYLDIYSPTNQFIINMVKLRFLTMVNYTIDQILGYHDDDIVATSAWYTRCTEHDTITFVVSPTGADKLKESDDFMKLKTTLHELDVDFSRLEAISENILPENEQLIKVVSSHSLLRPTVVQMTLVRYMGLIIDLIDTVYNYKMSLIELVGTMPGHLGVDPNASKSFNIHFWDFIGRLMDRCNAKWADEGEEILPLYLTIMLHYIDRDAFTIIPKHGSLVGPMVYYYYDLKRKISQYLDNKYGIHIDIDQMPEEL